MEGGGRGGEGCEEGEGEEGEGKDDKGICFFECGGVGKGGEEYVEKRLIFGI